MEFGLMSSSPATGLIRSPWAWTRWKLINIQYQLIENTAMKQLLELLSCVGPSRQYRCCKQLPKRGFLLVARWWSWPGYREVEGHNRWSTSIVSSSSCIKDEDLSSIIKLFSSLHSGFSAHPFIHYILLQRFSRSLHSFQVAICNIDSSITSPILYTIF